MTTVLAERIVIANQLRELPRMTRWLRDNAAGLGVNENAIFALDVCANEAVVNIISYAYGDDRHHQISLELQSSAAATTLVIRDDGEPFNPLEAAERDSPRTLEEAPIGGLGIRLIRRLMPRSRYRRADGVNELCLEA